MKHIITSSAKQTFNFAKKFACRLKSGEVIGLVGELGAGKTIFVKGLATGLGIKKNITSPTFVIMKIYPVKLPRPWRDSNSAGFNRVNKIPKIKTLNLKSKILNLIHIDAYRLKSAKDILAIGAQEYLGQISAITVIEWADRVKKILPKNTKFVNIISKGNNKRLIKY